MADPGEPRSSSSGALLWRRPELRYEILTRIASGGMATVFVGRRRGAAGFWRLYAIKRAHPHLVEEPAQRAVLVAEAKLTSQLSHPNVVSVLDVEEVAGELLLVMDYVDGLALADLLGRATERGVSLPPAVAVRIVLDACAGLHAAHELADERGRPIGLIHRDVSPQNILVGVDGIARVTDFGIAKAPGVDSGVRTQTGFLKGKLAYMAPEYVRDQQMDQRGDQFALAVVLWELFVGRRLFRRDNELETIMNVLTGPIPPVSSALAGADAELDAVCARALAREPAQRFSSMRAFADALELAAGGLGLSATHEEVGAFVVDLAGEELERRRERVRQRIAELDAAENDTGALPLERSAREAARPGDETTTRAVSAPEPRPRRLWRSSRPLLLGLGGVALGAAAVALLGEMGAAPGPAATTHMAPQPATATRSAPAADAPTTPPASRAEASISLADDAPSTAPPRASGAPASRSVARTRPSAAASGGKPPPVSPDPNPYAR
jgi:serine/threonine-protein kinase